MFRYQEARLGVILTWVLAPLASTWACFLFGTIWATPSDLDLRLYDIKVGGWCALIGLAIGIIFAIAVTVLYPPAVNRQYRQDAEQEEHHH